MGKREFTRYQQKVIGRYYDNREAITLNTLQELVTELYLADSEKKKDRLWERVAKGMDVLKVPQSIQSHILAQRDPKVLAANIADWLKK